MSTVTLRRAQQIANRINAETRFEEDAEDDGYYGRRRRAKVQLLVTSIVVSVDGNAMGKIDDARNALIAKRDRMLRLMGIGTRLRQELADANHRSGVVPLVTERVEMVQRQRVTEALLKSVENSVFDRADVEVQIKAAQSRLAGAGQTTGTLITTLFTAEDRDQLRATLITTKRRLLEIDDRLGELNAANLIGINNDDMAYLEQEGVA